MPPPPPPPLHHHGGHIPVSAFSDWGWSEPSVQYFVVQDESVPQWAWIGGGALALLLLAVLLNR
jgi:hypothetical protein